MLKLTFCEDWLRTVMLGWISTAPFLSDCLIIGVKSSCRRCTDIAYPLYALANEREKIFAENNLVNSYLKYDGNKIFNRYFVCFPFKINDSLLA